MSICKVQSCYFSYCLAFLQLACSSFRCWRKIVGFVTFGLSVSRFFVQKFHVKKTCVCFFGTSCDLIVHIQCNPMSLVHSILYQLCTRLIGLHWMLTIESHDVPEVRPTVELFQTFHKHSTKTYVHECHNMRNLKLERAIYIQIKHICASTNITNKHKVKNKEL